ncbi:conserved exported hypothetical protein [Candidatus Sulfopaludibacter sp. SbA3]|nr:conserved exported hypothetical protein [Candidatus Sulfopaludibacter sp. SbA3]
MKRAAIVVLAVAGLLTAADETRQERGKRILNEAIQALGGDAFLHMEDRTETGRMYSFYRDQISGLATATIYVRYLPPVPGKVMVREREIFGKKQDEGSLLFTENGAWDISFHGARPFDDLRWSNYQESTLRNIFYMLRQRLNEPGMSLYSQGSDFYERIPVEVVDITDGAGVTVAVMFDKFTKLPARQTYRRRNPQFKDFDTEVTAFAKYRDVGGGVKWPYDVRRERNGDKIYEMYSESVEIDKNLKDSLFSLPANVKMLPKAK